MSDFLPEAKYRSSNKLIQLDDIARINSKKWKGNIIKFDDAIYNLLDELKINHSGFELRKKFKDYTTRDLLSLVYKIHNKMYEKNTKYTLQDGVKKLRKSLFVSVIKGGSKESLTLRQKFINSINIMRKKNGTEPTFDDILEYDGGKLYELIGGLSIDQIMNGPNNCINFNVDGETMVQNYKPSQDFMTIILPHSVDELMKKFNLDTIGDLIFSKYISDMAAQKDMMIQLERERNYFKVPVEKQSRDWLTNRIIDRVLQRYESICPKFMRLLTCSRDYYNMPNENLSDFDIVKEIVRNNHTIFGAVFNTSLYSDRGEHWVCVVINASVEPYRVIYFDSNGCEPPVEIFNWCIKQYTALAKFAAESKIEPPQYICNNIMHQKSDSECGIYVLTIIFTEM
ncbi:MAG: hypothetical protein KDH96_07760, partial [Candidatus Riesia sp.]|nr:hypothetical protein [Candidatus Riesia sp.]